MCDIDAGTICAYHQLYNTRGTLEGNKSVGHPDVVAASPVGAAPTTSSFPVLHLASMDWVQTTARGDKNHLNFGIGAIYSRCFTLYGSLWFHWPVHNMGPCGFIDLNYVQLHLKCPQNCCSHENHTTGICMDLAIASVSDSGNVFCRNDIRPCLAICELLPIKIV